jgi:integrase
MKRRAKGEGSLFFSETEGLWVASITVDGKLRRKRSKKQRAVREWLDIQKEAVRKSLLVSDERLTVSEFLDKYMKEVGAHTLRPKTIESYSTLIRLHIAPEIGKVKLSQLRPTHLQTLYDKKMRQGLSKRTVEYIHAVIHKALDNALKLGLVSRNVADSVSPPTPDKTPTVALTLTQARCLVKALEGDPRRALWLLAIGTGLRRGELLGLQKNCVNLETGEIEVKFNLVEIKKPDRGDRLILGEPKSQASRRVVGLPDFAFAALKDHLDTDQVATEFVFHTSKGTPISPRNATRYFKEVLKRAGLPQTIRLHDLRHTAITWLLAKGVPPKDVQAVAGHSNFGVTMDLYGHVMPGAHQTAARKLDGLL